MRNWDAKLRLGRVSQKCMSSGGEGSSKHGEGSGSGLADGSRGPGGTTSTDSVSMVETYAVDAPKTGAVAAVNVIKAAEPVPELKGKTMAIPVVAIIEWLKMSKNFDWPVEEIVDKAWELARED